jgi:hypothetical protein
VHSSPPFFSNKCLMRHLFEGDELWALKSHVCQVLRRIENPGLGEDQDKST